MVNDHKHSPDLAVPPPSVFPESEFRTLRRKIIGLVAVLLVVITWGSIFGFLETTKHVALTMAEQNTASLALAFEESVRGTVTSIDQALLYLRRDYEDAPQKFIAAKALGEALSVQTLAVHLTVIDENGNVIASSAGSPDQTTYLGDREHFLIHKTRVDDFLFISKVVHGRLSNKWTIQFTRRLRKPNGAFGGVMVLGIDPFVLSKLTLDIGPEMALSVIGRDSWVRASPAMTEQTVGTSVNGGMVFEALKDSDNGTLVTEGILEPETRITSFRALRNYPLVVVVGLSQDYVLATYAKQRRQGLALGLFASALLVWFAVTLIRRFQDAPPSPGQRGPPRPGGRLRRRHNQAV